MLNFSINEFSRARLPQYLVSYVVHHDERFFVQQAIGFLYVTFDFFETVPRLGVLSKNS